MDIVKEHWLAGETAATLTEIAQILQREDGSNIPGPDSLLLFANIYYQLGILQEAFKLIKNGMAFYNVCVVIYCYLLMYTHVKVQLFIPILLQHFTSC